MGIKRIGKGLVILAFYLQDALSEGRGCPQEGRQEGGTRHQETTNSKRRYCSPASEKTPLLKLV